MKVIADLCIVPMGVGPSVSAYIREVREVLATTGLTHDMHANGTNIEGEMADVSAAVEACCARQIYRPVISMCRLATHTAPLHEPML